MRPKARKASKQRVRSKRHRAFLRHAWIATYESRYAELVTAAGTVIGSAIISLSGGMPDRWLLILVGALIILVGLLPTWARSTALSKEDRRDALLDARASVTDDYLRATLAAASSVIGLPRRNRVQLAQAEVQKVLDLIWERYYSSSGSIRVIFFAVSEDALRLEPVASAGRADEARVFDASVDERGRLGLERLEVEDDFEYHPSTADLPENWGATGRSYSAFLSVPVRVANHGYGLISVDSVDPAELDRRDGESIALFASALGFYFASADRGRHG